MMTPITDYRLILFSLVFWQTDANVNIVQTGTRTGEESFECGTKLVLTCQIDVYLSSMSWQNDSSQTPLAECIGSTCFVDPTVEGQFNISADENDGSFNLTIFQVTFENNGTNYMCGHDSTIESFLVKVKDYEPTVNESTPGIVEVSSGCIDQSTDVTFVWEKVKTDGAETESDYDPPNITESNITCMGDTNCEQSHFFKKTVSIRTVQGGIDDYHLRAKLCYDGFCVTSNRTKRTYTIEDEGSGNSTSEISCGIVCILLPVDGTCLVIYVIVGCLQLYVMLRPTEKEEHTEDKWSTSTHEILLNTLSAVLWIVIASCFICLAILCSCENTCDCCEELPLGIVFGILFFIHLVLWFILLCVLYNRTGKGDNEGDIHFKTKLEKVRIIFSTIPLVGLFPVCGWLIRIYRCEKCTIHDEQLTTEEKKPQLPSETKPNLANPKSEETGKQNSTTERKERKKVQAKLHKFDEKTIGSSEKADQISASDVIIVKPSGAKTYKQKSQKEYSAFTNSGTKQLSQNNGTVITSSQEHNAEHKKKVSDSQILVSYSEETSRRTMELMETKTGSENKPGSKDDVKREKKKSRKAKDENKNHQNTSMVRAETHTWNIDVTTTWTEDKLGSSDNDNPPNSSMSGKARRKSRKEKNDNKNPGNTKPGSADSHNGSETMKRALSANFHDEEDATTTVSIDSSTNM